jgi:PilZ domain
MGQRREPRKAATLTVRIFGTDVDGRPFSENVSTVNVSREGACVAGVNARIKVGEIVGIACGSKKGRLSVKWVGEPGTLQAGRVGLANLSPDKPLWDLPLPAPAFDDFGRHSMGSERRKHARLKCVNSVELHPGAASAPIWGKAVDLSMGGCFVEMPIPLTVGTKLKIGLWIKETKLWATAKVVNSRPGFGIGIEFTEISPEDTARLKQFLQSITRIPIK